VRRGQQEGAFRAAPEAWLLSTYFALMHAYRDEVAAGRLPAEDAIPTLQATLRRVFQTDAGAASWRERTLNAEHALKTANHEIIAQRTRIGELLGRIRDLEAEWTQDAIQRVTTENTTLKQRVRQLTADNRTLDERLNAARSNLRFQDRRIADLEARLADPSAAR